MNKTAPLSINSFSKNYGKFQAIDDVSLELNAGEVFGFLGPNGAGKSTTIRTILNFIKPSAGSITVYGLDSVNDSADIKARVGYLAGDIALYPSMTGNKILKYLTALGKETDWEYVDALVDRLEAQLNRPIHTLSKGNKQKIGLIQAFMHKPDLLVLDEPTSGLDPLMKQVFYDMVLEMKAEGKTIFVSSHDLTEVQKICDRAAFIRKGKLIATENIQNASDLTFRRYNVTFKSPPKAKDFQAIENVQDVSVSKNQLQVTVSGSIEPFITALAKHKPIDLDELDVTLDELFMKYYEQEN